MSRNQKRMKDLFDRVLAADEHHHSMMIGVIHGYFLRRVMDNDESITISDVIDDLERGYRVTCAADAEMNRECGPTDTSATDNDNYPNPSKRRSKRNENR